MSIRFYLLMLAIHIVATFLSPDISIRVRVFAIGPRDFDSIPGRVIPKTQKIVIDAPFLKKSAL